MLKINSDHKLFLVVIALFAALPPFAIDTYSPALTNITSYFKVSATLGISTFTSYFIGFAIGIITWGPLSDVYGRRKILRIGATLYLISSLLCPLSQTFQQLIIARSGQGFGDAACVTIAFATIRDCYSGQKLLHTLSSLGSIMILAPIVAPIIGVMIISSTHNWKDIFHFLSLYGVVLLILVNFIPETINPELQVRSIKTAFMQYKNHLFNLKFLLFSGMSCLTFSAMFSYIGSSAVIYFKIYNTTSFEYALFFAGDGVAILCANLLLKKLTYKLKIINIQTITLLMSLCVLTIAVCLAHFMTLGVASFFALTFVSSFFMSLLSNTSGMSALNQVHHAFGSAVSLQNGTKFLLAGFANSLMENYIYQVLGVKLFEQQLGCILLAGGLFCIYLLVNAAHKTASTKK